MMFISLWNLVFILRYYKEFIIMYSHPGIFFFKFARHLVGSFNLEMLPDPLNNIENREKNSIQKTGDLPWKRSKENSLDNDQKRFHNNSIQQAW